MTPYESHDVGSQARAAGGRACQVRTALLSGTDCTDSISGWVDCGYVEDSLRSVRGGRGEHAGRHPRPAPHQAGPAADSLLCWGMDVRQLAGSAPIFSPMSASAFMDSATKLPGFGGTQPSGTATMRTSISA